MKITLPIVAIAFAILSAQLHAGPLKGATLSRVVNTVEAVGTQGRPRHLTEREILGEDANVRVGVQSRAELIFSDRTLARLGAETDLGLRSGTRELSLDRGTLLIQVPKLCGGARIRTGSLMLSSGGATILLEHLPGKSLKAVVLEGEMRVSVPRFLGDSIVVPAGKMLITSPDVQRIPDPVDTDLRTLVSTSALTKCGPANAAAFAPLPSLPRIVREIARQEDSLREKRLIRTNLVIFGSGTNVVIPSAGDSAISGQSAGDIGKPPLAQERDSASRRTAEKGAPLASTPAVLIEPTPPGP